MIVISMREILSTMNISQAHIEALVRLRLQRREARFLYLVATHYEVFVARRFLNFRGLIGASAPPDFWTKLQSLCATRAGGRFRERRYYHGSRAGCIGAMERENDRNRRTTRSTSSKRVWHSPILVLAHSDIHAYSRKEPHKVAIFLRKRWHETPHLPSRIYLGIAAANTPRSVIS